MNSINNRCEPQRRNCASGKRFVKNTAPKIIINDTVEYFFLNCSRHFGRPNCSFRVLFDKIASVYII